MELILTPEQEARLVQMARHEGKTPSELVFDTTVSLYDADHRFRERVQRGLDQANAGNFIEEEEMDIRFEKMIRG
jgi:predicted transcriptional regulator